MTKKLDNEQASIEEFVRDVLHEVRPKGTSVAVTHVIVAATSAAADITSRTATGAIDKEEARRIFQTAARLMGRM